MSSGGTNDLGSGYPKAGGAKYGLGGTVAGQSGLSGKLGGNVGNGGTVAGNSGLARFMPQTSQPQPYAPQMNPGHGAMGATSSYGGDMPMPGARGSLNLRGMMGAGGSSALGNLNLEPLRGGMSGLMMGGGAGGVLGAGLGAASQYARSRDVTQPGSMNAINGMDAMSDAASMQRAPMAGPAAGKS